MNDLEKDNGFYAFFKPLGVSSYDVIRTCKRLVQCKKIGHAGTLDPFATGLLIVAIGRPYTKRIHEFQSMDKTYEFEMILGKTTPTLDPESEVTESQPYKGSESDLEEKLKKIMIDFLGNQQQLPPIFSAKKVNGKRAYQLARENKDISLSPSSVTIYELIYKGVTLSDFPKIKWTVRCSKGTYIRALVRDLGQKLGYPAYCSKLIRSAIGPIQLSQAVQIETKEHITNAKLSHSF